MRPESRETEISRDLMGRQWWVTENFCLGWCWLFYKPPFTASESLPQTPLLEKSDFIIRKLIFSTSDQSLSKWKLARVQKHVHKGWTRGGWEGSQARRKWRDSDWSSFFKWRAARCCSVFSCLGSLILHGLLGCQNASCFYLWTYMVFLWHTPLDGYTTFYLSIHQLMTFVLFLPFDCNTNNAIMTVSVV